MYPNINFAFVLPDLIADRLVLILLLIGSQRGWGRYNKHNNVRGLIMSQAVKLIYAKRKKYIVIHDMFLLSSDKEP